MGSRLSAHQPATIRACRQQNDQEALIQPKGDNAIEWPIRSAAPAGPTAIGRSLALDESNEDAALDDEPVAGLQTGRYLVPVTVAIAERDMAPREAAIGLLQVHEGQVLIVAQYRRNRNQQAAVFVLRVDQHAHVHLFLQ